MKSSILLTIFLLLVPLAGLAPAVELTPFQTRNLSPTALPYGLAVAESPKTLAAHQAELRISFDVANIATIGTAQQETIVLDAETYVTTLGLRYGLNRRLQIGLDIPYVKHDGGVLDGFINDWHDFFQLPTGDRDKLADDQLNLNYVRSGVTGFDITESQSGIGDLRLSLIWSVLQKEASTGAVKLLVKAPTGEPDDLTGSGAWDVSLAYLGQYDFSLPASQASVWAGLAGTLLGEGEVLEDRVKDWTVSGWLGAGWAPLDWLALKLQLDGHSALYDSDLSELGDPALMLTMGGTLAFGERTSLDLGVGEDLAVVASPDITFQLALRHRF
jgi:hypothetical protein